MSVDGSDVRKVMGSTVELDGKKVRYEGGLAWSPDGQLLASVGYYMEEKRGYRRRDGDLVLYTVKADGSDARRVGDWPARYGGGLAWSPDGQRLAFVGSEADSSADGDDETPFVMYIVEAGGSGPERRSIVPQAVSPRLLSPLAWSPDGQSIAFLARIVGGAKLYTMGRDGFVLREVTDAGASSSWYGASSRSVAWSPDGSQILFSLNSYRRSALYLVGADGSGLHVVGGGSHGAWSPDGSRIAALELLYGSALLSLRTMAPDGLDVRVLARGKHVLEAVGPGQWRSPADPAACSAGVAVRDPGGNPGLVRDCEALMQLRDRLSGSTRLNWETNRSIFSWEGVTVDTSALREESSSSDETASRLRVTRLSLRARGLRGIIPPEVAHLTELQVLDLSHNELPGPIPPELGNLENLTTLDLEYNGVWGPIPPESGNLRNLTMLNLWENRLSGSIPPELGNLESLTELELGRNDLSGPIPPELGSLENLTTLSLAFNDLSGRIPPELGDLENLTALNLVSNDLSGRIPPELGDLESLTTLFLGDNDLSGPIPPELGNLEALRELYLSGNGGLTGCIPPGLYGKVEGYWEPGECRQ